MKEVSVNLKGSSFLEGHGVERRDCEEKSLSFWRGDDEEEEEEGRESSKDSAIWRTNGSERAAIRVMDLSFLVLVKLGRFGVVKDGDGVVRMIGVKAETAIDGGEEDWLSGG